MIPFFLGYALIVWWPAVVYRRRWGGWLAVILGTLVLVALIKLHALIGQRTNGQIFVPVFQSILVPYAFLIAGVGAYINILPKTHARGHCGRCGYNLDGLDADLHVCPECGRSFTTSHRPLRRRAESSDDQPPDEPQQQHAQGHAHDEPPRDRRAKPGRDVPDACHGPGRGPLRDQLVLPAQPQQR